MATIKRQNKLEKKGKINSVRYPTEIRRNGGVFFLSHFIDYLIILLFAVFITILPSEIICYLLR